MIVDQATATFRCDVCEKMIHWTEMYIDEFTNLELCEDCYMDVIVLRRIEDEKFR